jgi:hypothetical protein
MAKCNPRQIDTKCREFQIRPSLVLVISRGYFLNPMNGPDIIALVGAVGNWAIAIVAVAGGWIGSRLLRARLCLEKNPEFPRGEFIERPMTQDGHQQTRQERWYHLRVSNGRAGRFPPANQTQVLIRRRETPGPDGRPQVQFTGRLPLSWQHSQMWPLARTVGPPAIADLLFVTEEPSLSLTPIAVPFNLPNQGRYTVATRFWVIVQAQSTEATSKALKVEIAWDGQWDRGEAEMAHHLKVCVINEFADFGE